MLESNDFIHLLSYFEAGEMGLELGDTHLHYCLYDDRVQVVREFRVAKDYSGYYTDEMSMYTLLFKNAANEANVALAAFLKEYLVDIVRAGTPLYLKSDVFSEKEWNELMGCFIKCQKK
jgi:hypothetical protein